MILSVKQKASIVFYVLVAINFLAFTIYVFYKSLHFIGVKNADLFLVPVAILLSFSLFTGLYKGIKVHYFGQPKESTELNVYKKGDEVYLFWLVAPLTIPVLGFIFSLPLSLINDFITLPILTNVLKIQNSEALLVEVTVIICVILAIITQIYLWKQFKKRKNS